MTFNLFMTEFSELSAVDGAGADISAVDGAGADTSAVDGACADKFSSTVHTVGRLSNKFARRVYNILSSQVQNLNKDNVQQYINSLATIMHLTNYLSALNQNLKATTSKNETQNSEENKSSGDTQKTEEKKSTIA